MAWKWLIMNQTMPQKMLVPSCRHIFGDKKEKWVAGTMEIGFEGHQKSEN